jgi:hypothetical protein
VIRVGDGERGCFVLEDLGVIYLDADREAFTFYNFLVNSPVILKVSFNVRFIKSVQLYAKGIFILRLDGCIFQYVFNSTETLATKADTSTVKNVYFEKRDTPLSIACCSTSLISASSNVSGESFKLINGKMIKSIWRSGSYLICLYD